MFIIMVTYKKPLEDVDCYIVAHRQFLDEGYKKDYFVASGPRNPRTGGIIISQLSNKQQLLEIMKNDPFVLNDIADYEFFEFSPVKYHEQFSHFVNN